VYTRIYLLKFPHEIVDQPIICKLATQHDTEFNILRANVLPKHEGIMILELKGEKTCVKEGVAYLRELGVTVETMATGIRRDDEKCFQCGACTGICPTGALSIKRPDMEILFDPEKCSGCSLCVTLCPVRAMEVSLDRNGGLPEKAMQT